MRGSLLILAACLGCAAEVMVSCPDGQAAVDGRCLTGCNFDSECAADEACVEGACIAFSGCDDHDGDGHGDGCRAGPDCDDNNARVHAAILAYPDLDGDGMTTTKAVPVCEPALPEKYRTEASGDDCDDTDSALFRSHQAFVDQDSDGYTVGEKVAACGAAAVPAGYAQESLGSDCDDAAVLKYRLVEAYWDADGDGYTGDAPVQACAGASLPPGYHAGPTANVDCAPDDPGRYRLLKGYEDKDRDGYAAGALLDVCAGERLPAGYEAAYQGGSEDCNPESSMRFVEVSYYKDSDRDGYTTGAKQSCGPIDDWPNPETRRATPSDPLDADDSDKTCYRHVQLYQDEDQDGFTSWRSETLCIGATIPAPWIEIEGPTDCDDSDGEKYISRYIYRDSDGDGYGGAYAYTCIGAEVPEGFVWHADGDCDDTDPDLFRHTSLWRDVDGDGVATIDAVDRCIGELPPLGFSLDYGYDCAPADGAAYQPMPVRWDSDHDGKGEANVGQLCAGATPPIDYVAESAPIDCMPHEADDRALSYADLDGDGGPGPTSECAEPGTAPPEHIDCAEWNSHRHTLRQFYVDQDGDGVANGIAVSVCAGDRAPRDHYVDPPTVADCDDGDGARYPGALEIPGDGVDDDCSGADLAIADANAVFVDGQSCAGGDGTAARPFCTIAEAAAQGSLVLVTAAGEQALDLRVTRDLTLVGGYQRFGGEWRTYLFGNTSVAGRIHIAAGELRMARIDLSADAGATAIVNDAALLLRDASVWSALVGLANSGTARLVVAAFVLTAEGATAVLQDGTLFGGGYERRRIDFAAVADVGGTFIVNRQGSIDLRGVTFWGNSGAATVALRNLASAELEDVHAENATVAVNEGGRLVVGDLSSWDSPGPVVRVDGGEVLVYRSQLRGEGGLMEQAGGTVAVVQSNLWSGADACGVALSQSNGRLLVANTKWVGVSACAADFQGGEQRCDRDGCLATRWDESAVDPYTFLDASGDIGILGDAPIDAGLYEWKVGP
jgi:hypothetical protein